LGESTIVVESGGTSAGRSRQSGVHGSQSSTSYSVNSNANWAEHNRRLLRPEEIFALHERSAITFCPGLPPILTTLERFYERNEPRWQRLSAAMMFMQCLILFSVAMLLLMAVLGVNIHGGSR